MISCPNSFLRSSLTDFLVRTADDLDLVGVQYGLVIELEVDVFDEEGPYVVAEAICVEMSFE